jgi:hypothetical protein
MISHVDAREINIFLQNLKDILFGDYLAESTGKIHDYLGMQFNFSFQGKVRINMMQYIPKMIEEFPEEIVGKLSTPAADHLFKVRDYEKKMDEEQADTFHCPVYQLLFAANSQDRTFRQQCPS